MVTKNYENLDIGGEIIVPHKEFGDIPFIVIGKDHDAPNSLTLMTKEIVRLMPFDAREPNKDPDRHLYGNNRYSQSNILQWMNSEAEAGKWYEPQHKYDQAPNSSNVWIGFNPYADKPGLLNGFDKDFKDRIITVDKTVALNTVTDGGGSEIVSSKIFLLSRTEVGLGNENGIAEGTIYEYFSNNNTNQQRIAYPSEYCLNNAGGYSYKDDGGNEFAVGKPWIYWLRTPQYGNSCNVRRVWWDGRRNGWSDAWSGNCGLRFGLVISNNQ